MIFLVDYSLGLAPNQNIQNGLHVMTLQEHSEYTAKFVCWYTVRLLSNGLKFNINIPLYDQF